MYINVREVSKEMAHAYRSGRKEWYQDAYKMMLSAWQLGFIHTDDMDKIQAQDAKLFEEENA